MRYTYTSFFAISLSYNFCLQNYSEQFFFSKFVYETMKQKEKLQLPAQQKIYHILHT